MMAEEDVGLDLAEYAEYFARALLQFPTPTLAIKGLENLGDPPSLTVFSDPTRRVNKGCQAVRCLPSHLLKYRTSTSTLILAHWDSVIYPWINFVLRQSLLSRFEESSVSRWSSVLEYFTTVLPILFQAIDSDGLKSMKHASRSLQPLVLQVFLLQLDCDSPSWGMWANSLKCLALCDALDSAPSTLTQYSDHPFLYPVDHVLGEMLIRILDIKVTRLRKMTCSELHNFKHLVMVLCVGSHCFQGKNPTTLATNLPKFINSLTSILVMLLRKRRTLMGLHELLDNPVLAQIVIHSGILDTLYFAHDWFYEIEELDTDGDSISGKFTESSAQILDRIATYLVYPSVARSFARYVRKFDSQIEAVLERFRPKSDTLAAAWCNVILKAQEINRCTSETVKRLQYQLRTKGEESGINTEMKYFRCHGCSHNLYCSLACQKADWIAGHCEECPITSNLIKTGMSLLTTVDLKFFEIFARMFIPLRAKDQNDMVETYRSSVSQREILTPDQQRISSGIQHPILWLDFGGASVPSTRHNAEVMDRSSLAARLNNAEGCSYAYAGSLLGIWDGSGSQLMVLAWFPLSRGLMPMSDGGASADRGRMVDIIPIEPGSHD
ncbi:hypothetical protein PM082_019624 [Marasmius tenuissimus]|nr:hypothetical protein PM082_019624 [Marasmius tenuissimus]